MPFIVEKNRKKIEQKLCPESLYRGKARYGMFGQLQRGRSEPIRTTISKCNRCKRVKPSQSVTLCSGIVEKPLQLG